MQDRHFKGSNPLWNILLLLAFVLISACSEDGGLGVEGPKVGEPAPDFSLESLEGGVVKLSDQKGKVIVLFFFGNSCPSCKGAAPSIESKIQQTFGEREDFILLGLDQWNGNAASVQSFKSSTGVSFSLLLKAANAAAAYSSTYDRLVVIDAEGVIRFNGTRGAKSDVNDVMELVGSLLEE